MSRSWYMRSGIGSLVAIAYLATSYPADAGQITVKGSDKDGQTFNDMIKACRKKSKAFDKMISDIENDKGRGGNVSVDVGRSGGYVDNATGGKGHTDVNLSNVEQFPDPDVDGMGHIKNMPKGVPPWATTRCEIIAHFLREAHSTAATDSATIDMGHRAGITCQNDIRTGFGQTLKCGSSNNEYSDPDQFKGFLYVQVSYGTNANEKLRFDKDGKLSIGYYSSGSIEYVPPKEPAKPKGTEKPKAAEKPKASEKPKAAPSKPDGDKRDGGGSDGGISYDDPQGGSGDAIGYDGQNSTYVVAPPVQTPIDCFGDAGCERELARQRGVDITRVRRTGKGEAPAVGPGPSDAVPGSRLPDVPCLNNPFGCAEELRTNREDFSRSPQTQPNEPRNLLTNTNRPPATTSPQPSNNTTRPRQ